MDTDAIAEIIAESHVSLPGVYAGVKLLDATDLIDALEDHFEALATAILKAVEG